MFFAVKSSKRISILRMIGRLVFKLCFPQIDEIPFREKRVQSFENKKIEVNE